MGFQQPPVLPDYSRLTFLLNNSGVQKWNPSVYDILKQLIQAVQQSQDTFISNEITNIVNNSINNGGIIIPSGTPSAVFSASGTVTLAFVPAGTGNQPFAAHTIFGNIAAVPGKVIWPIAIYVTGGQTITGSGGAWNTTTGWEVVWNGVGGPVISSTGSLFTTVFASSSFSSVTFPTIQTVTTLNAFQGIDLNVRTSNTGTILGSTFPASTVANAVSWSLIYALL